MSIRPYLLIDTEDAGASGPLTKEKRHLSSLIREKVMPEMIASLPASTLPESYPWCFVMPEKDKKREGYYIGAFILFRDDAEKKRVITLYSRVNDSFLISNLCSSFPAPFWMARILNRVQKAAIKEETWRDIRHWINALKKSYSPLWEKITLPKKLRFENRKHLLIQAFSEPDYRLNDSDGVEIIPWLNWPDCIKENNDIWLWRQSRHLNFLDSQRIHL